MLRSAVNFFKSQPIYDLRPWFCVLMGAFAVGHAKKAATHIVICGTSPDVLFGGMLFLCAAAIFYMRLTNRVTPAKVGIRKDNR